MEGSIRWPEQKCQLADGRAADVEGAHDPNGLVQATQQGPEQQPVILECALPIISTGPQLICVGHPGQTAEGATQSELQG